MKPIFNLEAGDSQKNDVFQGNIRSCNRDNIFSRYFLYIEVNTLRFQKAILLFLNSEWDKNSELLIAKLQFFADQLDKDVYRECILATKDYINSRDFIAPDRYEATSYFYGALQYNSESQALKNLNQKLDQLIQSIPQKTTTWAETFENIYTKTVSTLLFALDFAKENSLSILTRLLYGQIIITSAFPADFNLSSLGGSFNYTEKDPAAINDPSMTIFDVDNMLKSLQDSSMNDIRQAHQNIVELNSLSQQTKSKELSSAANFVPLTDLSVLNELVNIIKKAKQETKSDVDFSQIALVCVQHYLGQTIALVQAFKALGIESENIFMLGKLYSAEEGVYEGLNNEAIQALPVDPTKYKSDKAFSEQFDEEVKNLWENAEHQLTDKIKAGKIKKIIILDDGGKCILEGIRRENNARKLSVYPTFWQAVKNRGIQFAGIEQTSAGLKAVIDAAYSASSNKQSDEEKKEEKTKQAKELLELTFPVIQVASGALKRVIEPPQVAESFINKVKKKLGKQIDHAFQEKPFKIGLIGYGNIGQALVEALEHNDHVIFTVFDKDKAKVLEAEEKRYGKANFKVVDSLKDVISSSDYIFSCTGKDVFRDEQAAQIQQIMEINGNKILYSGSSENIEFLSLIKWLAEQKDGVTFPDVPLDPILYQKKNYTVEIGYGGYPFNFSEDEKSVPVKHFQPMLSALFMGVIQGIEVAALKQTSTQEEIKGLFVKLRSQYQQLILSLSFPEQATQLIGKYPKEDLKIFNDVRYIVNHSAYNDVEYYDILTLAGKSKQRPTKDDIGDECELMHSLELYVNKNYIADKKNKFESYGKLTILNRPSYHKDLFVESKDKKHENKTYLAQLRERLQKDQRVTLFGLGGVGKSYLATAYSHLYQQDYDIIYWIAMSGTREDDDEAAAEAQDEKDISAIDRKKIIPKYVILLNHLGVSVDPDEPDEVIRLLKHHLSIRAEHWLLIYDDVADPRQLKDIVPTSGGHIIITSRYRKWEPAINLACFQLQESVNYLFSACKNKIPYTEENERLATEIADKLGNLPLALTHAAAYINNEESFGFKDYLEDFNKDPYSVLQEDETGYDHHKIIVTKTWYMMMRKLEQKNELVKFIMACCAYLAPNAIPIILFYDKPKHKQEIDDAIKLLKDYSVLYQHGADRSKIDIHCLVQAVIRGELKNSGEQAVVQQLCEAQNMPMTPMTHMLVLGYLQHALHKRFLYDTNNIETFDRSKELIWHMRSVLKYSDSLALKFSQELCLLGMTFVSLSNAYLNLGYLQRAKEFSEFALTISEHRLAIFENNYCEEVRCNVVVTLVRLGIAYRDLGDVQQQKALLERALAIQENHYGKDHYKVAGTLVDLGVAYGKLGDVHHEKALLERALVIQKKHYGRVHAEVALIRLSLGYAYFKLQDYNHARRHFKFSYQVFLTFFGFDDEHTQKASRVLEAIQKLQQLQQLQQILESIQHKGSFEESQKGFLLSKLEQLERTLGINNEKNTEVAGTLLDEHEATDPARAIQYAGVNQDSHILQPKELLERALVIKENHYGRDHYERAKVLVALGVAYQALGNVHRQKAVLERALPILEDYYGRDHYEVAETLVTLGVAYGDLGDIHHKKALLERALPILEEHYGRDHYEVAKTLVKLGVAYGDLGDIYRKKALLERALSILEDYYGRDHYEVAETLVELGIVYGDLGDIYRKKALLERALPILEEHYGRDHCKVARTLANLSAAYMNLGDVQQAIELSERVLTILENHYGRDHYEMAKLLANLGNIYSDLGDVHRGKALLERVLPILEEHYGRDHYEVAKILVNLGNVYGKLGDVHYEKALLKRALVIQEKHYGRDHTEVAITRSHLGYACSALQDYNHARRHFEFSYKVFLIVFGSNDERTQIASQTLKVIQKFQQLQQIQQILTSNQHEATDPARVIRYAVVHQDTHILQLLLEKYPDKINIPDKSLKKGYTALHLAVLHNKQEHIKCLLQHNARTDILDRHGKTAIDYAREKGLSALFSGNSKKSELELSDNKEKVEEKVIEKQKMTLNPS